MSACLKSKNNHECFKDILDEFPVPVIIAGFGVGPILYLNDHARELLRVNVGSAVFVNTSDFYVDPGRRKEFVELVLSRGYVKEFELEFKDSLGTRFWGMVSSKRISYNGQDCLLSTVIDITIRKNLERELLYSSQYDFLTETFNRRHFVDVLASEVLRSKRYRHGLSLIMIDADNFKNVNDRYGHVVGDSVLKWLCSLVQTALRQTDLLGRIGGEEFAVMLPETGAEGATMLAERIRYSVESSVFTAKSISLNMTLSLGVSSLIDADDSESIFKRSDDALIEAKTNGKNRVVFR